ncbi:MAG TPA: hypothetical protein VHE83_04525, partial [Mycobacteriales bacterium]|nr:hypothetical protein [Mycobacteriales bacterium]
PPDALPQRVLWALQHAILAPSLHNSQPWVFRWLPEPPAVELYADVRRHVRILDSRGRQLIISCGAALENLLVALRAAGLDASSVYARDEQSGLLATVGVALGAPPSDADVALARAVALRQTARAPFADDAVPVGLLMSLLEVGREHGTEVRLVQRPGERAGLARWTQVAHRIESYDSQLLQEIAAWTRPVPGYAEDGIVPAAYGRTSAGARSAVFPQRDFALGRAVPSDVGRPDPGDVTIVVISTRSDERDDWLAAGRTLSAVLLTTALHGVQGSYLNQAIEVPELRPRVCEELAIEGFPQLILRLGYPIEAARPVSPRRPLSRVLVT